MEERSAWRQLRDMKWEEDMVFDRVWKVDQEQQPHRERTDAVEQSLKMAPPKK